ncbi:MAG: DAK2 domain-containing protein, partial [bacterium]|nr:DAK2 domain-containing protein [bacterium]
METKLCDGQLLKTMFVAGGRWLSLHRGILNELNVFPVPDGDTGTNMTLTMRGLLSPLLIHRPSANISKVAAEAARGALLGARGNSGVILSQVFRGFSEALSGHEQADTRTFAKALRSASVCAYKSVQVPKEGTILTVIRKSAEVAEQICDNTPDLTEFFGIVTNAARHCLIDSRDELEALRNAGVVDAGGLGLVYIFEGIARYGRGEQLVITDRSSLAAGIGTPHEESLNSEIEFGYCTEFLVEGTSINPEDIRPQLEKLGNSLVIAKTADILKVHIHTNAPALVEALVTPGCKSFRRKVENMRAQNDRRREEFRNGTSSSRQAEDIQEELAIIESPDPETVKKADLPPMVMIAQGEGFTDYFTSWGAKVVNGGQTANPSTEEILKAIQEAGADKEILVFPNNKNCFGAALQAASLSGKPVKIIETVSPCQAADMLSAGIITDASAPQRLASGEAVQAVKDACVQGHEIKKGDFLALWNGELTAVKDNLRDTVFALLSFPPKPSFKRLTVAAGEDCDPDELE